MDKMYKRGLTIIIGIILIFICTGVVAYFIGRANAPNNTRVEQYQQEQRELLARIGDYERRESERINRETQRITAERERIERTENAIRALRESDRRSSSLLQELEQEINILADYFRDTSNQYRHFNDSIGSE